MEQHPRLPRKTIGSSGWIALLAGMGFILAGCEKLTPTAPPTVPTLPRLPSPTPAPPYIHYAPSETSNIHLEFDYPGSWMFLEENGFIGLIDPRFLTVPTRPPDEPHGTPSDYPSITIRIEPNEPGQTLDTLAGEYKHSHEVQSSVTALGDYQITIDGYNARVLEYRVEPEEFGGHLSTMFVRYIFFSVGDQIYVIHFDVAEYERGGEFEQGYEYFFKSLQVVP